VTPETVSATVIPILRQAFDHIALVSVLRSGDPERLGLLGRPELDVTFTKIHLWNPNVLPFERVIFMDADAMPLRNVDELFETVAGDVDFAAAPDQVRACVSRCGQFGFGYDKIWLVMFFDSCVLKHCVSVVIWDDIESNVRYCEPPMFLNGLEDVFAMMDEDILVFRPHKNGDAST